MILDLDCCYKQVINLKAFNWDFNKRYSFAYFGLTFCCKPELHQGNLNLAVFTKDVNYKYFVYNCCYFKIVIVLGFFLLSNYINNCYYFHQIRSATAMNSKTCPLNFILENEGFWSTVCLED